MQDYKEYLATHVLNDSETVNYRMLSRALKVHSHRAKQCLFDFHSRQTQKKPNSVYATYLIAGRRKSSGQTNGTHSQQTDDVPMPSSPVPSSSMPEPSQEVEDAPSWTRVVLLAKEADLDNAKASFDQIDSIHIYSLSPGAPSDLQTLGECARRVMVDYGTEDPLENWAQYGVIQNPNVWRRTRKGQPVPPPAATISEPVAKKATATAVKKEPSPTVEDKKPAASKSADTKPPPTLKRDRSSIMSSFARTQAPKKSTAKEADPEEPALSDEDADPNDDPDLDDSMALDAPAQQPSGKSKREREEELRRMMEADSDPDEAMPDAPAPAAAAAEEPPEDESASSAVDTPTVTQEPPQSQEQSSQQGRRRGRRRVMKKRTVKDEEGYLVTKEEAVWESFSEDEEAQPAKKAKPAVSAATTKKPAANATQTGPKSQAGIMSFFAKR